MGLNPGIVLFIPVLLNFFLVLFGGPEGRFAPRFPLVWIGAEVFLVGTVGGILTKNGGHTDEALHFGVANLALRQRLVAHLLLHLKDGPVFLALVFVSR